jgi:hypothetical protein
MRTIIFAVFLFSFAGLQAQTFIPSPFVDNNYRGSMSNNIRLNDSSSNKKLFFTHYSGLSTSFVFSKSGSATIVSAPMGIQLNRRLNNNLFAFAGVSVAPAYISFNRSFMTADFNKAAMNNMGFKSSSLGLYSRAELGLQYVNDERTFSISGSIGVERNSYPMPIHYQNNLRPRQLSSTNQP